MSADPRHLGQALSAVPTFLVPDVGTAIRWYVQNLGFRIGGTFPAAEPYAYASIHLGGAEVMFLRLQGYAKPDLAAERPQGLWDAYVRMHGVRQFYERVQGKAFVCMQLTKQQYGDWEFEVRDPNGYAIVFGGDAD